MARTEAEPQEAPRVLPRWAKKLIGLVGLCLIINGLANMEQVAPFSHHVYTWGLLLAGCAVCGVLALRNNFGLDEE